MQEHQQNLSPKLWTRPEFIHAAHTAARCDEMLVFVALSPTQLWWVLGVKLEVLRVVGVNSEPGSVLEVPSISRPH